MSSVEIAAQIAAAYTEAGVATGTGPLTGTIVRGGAVIGGTDYAPVHDTATNHDFNIVLGKFTNREREGTAILATDVKISCSVGEVEPLVSDVMQVRGVDYEIFGVDPLQPGGDVLNYTIWARA